MNTQRGITTTLALVWLGALVLAAGAGTYYYQNYYHPGGGHHATVQGHDTPDGLTPPESNSDDEVPDDEYDEDEGFEVDDADNACVEEVLPNHCYIYTDEDNPVLVDNYLQGTWKLVSQTMHTPAGNKTKDAHGHTLTFDVRYGTFTEDFSTETVPDTVVPNPVMTITNTCRGEGAISGTFKNIYTPATDTTPEVTILKVRSVTSNTAKTVCESNTNGPASVQEMKTPPTFPITMAGPSGSRYKVIWPEVDGAPVRLIITTTMPNGVVVESKFTQISLD